MLRAMLDSHPAMAVPPESYFVGPSIRFRERYETGGLRVDRLLEDVLGAGSFGEWQLDAEVVRAAVRADPPADVPDLIRRVYREYARQRGKERYADKTPYHVLQIERLAGAFPEARFVHLVRDGRDVVPSLIGMPFAPDRFGPGVLYWRRHVTAGREAGAVVGPGRYREVRYEELVEDPEAVLTDLCAFVELDYDPAMLGYHERSGEVLRGLRRDAHLQGISRPPTRRLRDWRTSLPPADLELFEALAGDVTRELGYEPSGVTVGAATRARAAAVVADQRVRGPLRRVRRQSSRRLRELRRGRQR